jgi:hypothetical protein
LVTGRPPILKKKSIFEKDVKGPNILNSFNDDKKKEDASKGRLPPSKIFNIMKKFEDRR